MTDYTSPSTDAPGTLHWAAPQAFSQAGLRLRLAYQLNSARLTAQTTVAMPVVRTENLGLGLSRRAARISNAPGAFAGPDLALALNFRWHSPPDGSHDATVTVQRRDLHGWRRIATSWLSCRGGGLRWIPGASGGPADARLVMELGYSTNHAEGN